MLYLASVSSKIFEYYEHKIYLQSFTKYLRLTLVFIWNNMHYGKNSISVFTRIFSFTK